MASSSVALFIRPRNMAISTILQTLSVAASFAERSGGKLTFTHAPREPYAQRTLSYTGIVIADKEVAHSISNQPNFYVGLTKRAAMSHSTLYYQLPTEQRGPSLADIASIVGFRMAGNSTDLKRGEELTDEEDKDIAGNKRLLTGMECKIERRQNAARHRPSKKSYSMEARNTKRLVEAMNDFGGFSGRLNASNRY